MYPYITPINTLSLLLLLLLLLLQVRRSGPGGHIRSSHQHCARSRGRQLRRGKVRAGKNIIVYIPYIKD